MARRKRLTPEERRQRLQDTHERLNAAVEGLLTSDGWRDLIASGGWLRRYSLNNILLILRQCPGASDVRPMRTGWNAVGRRVRKGEKSIKILAPITYRREENPDGEPGEEPGGDGESGAGASGGRGVRGFKVEHVYDISQTEGEPLDVPPGPAELRGAAPTDLWDGVAAQITAHGYSIERGDCGTAYGRVTWAERTVRVRADVEPAQAVKTLTHELAHIRCDHETRKIPRLVREIEAESVACLVASACSLDTLAYSVPYVAGWARDPETAHATAETVMSTADAILSDLETARSRRTAQAA